MQIDLEREIAAAIERQRARKEAAEQEERERERKKRLEREQRGHVALANLLGAEFEALIVDFEHRPDKGVAYPALFLGGRQFHYEWTDHAHDHREHWWVRDDGVRTFFNATRGGGAQAEERRDAALIALAICAKQPPVVPGEEPRASTPDDF